MNKQKIKLVIKENKLVRAIAKPFANYKRKKDLDEYLHSADSEYIKNLKGIHQGEMCFVIGNGPSLRPEDLNQLSDNGWVCFGTNRIYHIYDQTHWRPTYYVSLDVNGLETEIERIKHSGSYEKFINFKGRKFGRDPEDNIHYVFTYGRFKTNPYELESNTLSEDASNHISKVATVTVNAIELAIYMGFKEIYLLGVDNNYARKRSKDGKIYSDPSIKSSYFAGMKDGNGKLGDGISVQTVDYMDASYDMCKTFADKMGVKIINVTRGGRLETFDRQNFDEVMGKSV